MLVVENILLVNWLVKDLVNSEVAYIFLEMNFQNLFKYSVNNRYLQIQIQIISLLNKN